MDFFLLNEQEKDKSLVGLKSFHPLETFKFLSFSCLAVKYKQAKPNHHSYNMLV